MTKPDVEHALTKFFTDNNCDGIFLIGYKDGKGDFGVITKEEDSLNDKIVQVLEMKQKIKEIWNLKSQKYGGRFFDQLSRGSRKVVLPIVHEALKLAVAE